MILERIKRVIKKVIIGGIITPDVSGVTQIIVAVPMTALYFIGIGWAYAIKRRRERRERDELGGMAPPPAG